MIPVALVAERPAILLAGDTITLNQGDGNVVSLAKVDFTPSPDLVVGDLTEADFPGYAAITSTTTPTEGRDPNTGDYLVTIPPPAGGWRWETTGAVTPTQTIYGYYFTNQDSGNLLASAKFDEPYILTSINQEIIIPAVQLRLLAGSIV